MQHRAPLSAAVTRGRLRLLYAIGLVVLIGMAAALVYHGVQAVYLHRGYPLNTFLFLPRDRFGDFFNDYRYAQHFSPTKDMVAYSAPVMALLKTATIVPATAAFVVLVLTFLSTLGIMLWAYATPGLDSPLARIHYTLLLGLFTYPVLFIVDRGNLDMVVFIALAAFFYAYLVRHSRWSWIFLAFAISAKYYPATLAVLFLCDKRYRQFLFTFLGAAALTLGSAAILSITSGRSTIQVLVAVGRQLVRHDVYARTIASVQHGHGYWGILSWIVGSAGVKVHKMGMKLPGIEGWSRPYLFVALVLFVLLTIYTVRYEKCRWKQVALLVAAFLLLPYESHDYTLVFLYFPLILLLHDTRGRRLDLVYGLLLAVPLVPTGYVVFGHTDVTISIFVYPVALTALVALIVAEGLVQPAAPALPPDPSGSALPWPEEPPDTRASTRPHRSARERAGSSTRTGSS
jgi:hypothetical protein